MLLLRKLFSAIRNGVLSLFLALCLLLSGCAGNPVLTPVQPPDGLLQSTPAPTPTGEKNADLARFTQALRYALESCNADKASLREWVQRVSP